MADPTLLLEPEEFKEHAGKTLASMMIPIPDDAWKLILRISYFSSACRVKDRPELAQFNERLIELRSFFMTYAAKAETEIGKFLESCGQESPFTHPEHEIEGTSGLPPWKWENDDEKSDEDDFSDR